MAAATASLVLPMAPSFGNCNKVRPINGLKPRASLYSMTMPTGANQAFAGSASALRASTKCRRRSARGLGARCNAVGEIFKIAAIMNGLTLVGVAVGFVLLRIEAFVEESEV